MKAEALKNDMMESFVIYCKKHRMEIDDSFLYDEDLRDFKADDENPTYIIKDEQGEIAAAASLIIDDYNRRGKKARFRIFHSEINNIEYYDLLLKAILKHTEGLDKVFEYVPVVNEKLTGFIEKLNFTADRYSFLLVRDNTPVPEFSLPEGYEIKPFESGTDEKVWCEVRNPSFAKLKGSETPITPEMVSKLVLEDEHIEGGMLILYHNEKPVGVVRGSKDEYEELPIMNIGPLAIIPEYQGKGLGRIILRTVLNFAAEHSYERTILCVNAENERAKKLYLNEGFKQVEAVTCYRYDL